MESLKAIQGGGLPLLLKRPAKRGELLSKENQWVATTLIKYGWLDGISLSRLNLGPR